MTCKQGIWAADHNVSFWQTTIKNLDKKIPSQALVLSKLWARLQIKDHGLVDEVFFIV